MANWYTLQQYSPQPNPGAMLTKTRFSTSRTSIVIVTTREHGFESCDIGYPQRLGEMYYAALLPRPLDEFWPNGHLTVRGGANTIFQGRASRPPKFINGGVHAITAVGYWDALSDFYFQSSTDTTTTTSGEVIKKVLVQANMSITIDQEYWADPGVSHAPSEFDGQRGGAVIQTLLNEGNVTPYDLQFWTGPNDTIRVQLRDRNAPSIADFTVPWIDNEKYVNLTYDPQLLYGHVRVRYTPAGGSETVTAWIPSLDDNTFLDKWGFDRQLEINGGQLTDAGANQLAQTTYQQVSIPQWNGSINCDDVFPMLGIDGNAFPHPQVFAGRWIRVRGLTDNDGRTPVLLQIQEARCDVRADTLQLTVARGMSHKTFSQKAVETVNAVRTGRNPVSAAKAS